MGVKTIKKTTTQFEPFLNIIKHYRSRLDTCTPITRGGDILVLWINTSTRNEMMQPCKCFQHASKVPTLEKLRAILVLLPP